MRKSARVAFAVMPLLFWLSASAQPVAACTGQEATLAAGVHGATSIYYARIVAEKESSVGFYDLHLAVGKVVRGTASAQVSHLITSRPCDSLSVGQSGIVMLGSVDPFGVGPNDVYNFFYVLGPGHTSAAAAATLLGGLPATDTVPGAAPIVRGSNPLAAFFMVLFVSVAAGLLVLQPHHHR